MTTPADALQAKQEARRRALRARIEELATSPDERDREAARALQALWDGKPIPQRVNPKPPRHFAETECEPGEEG